jgi:hypothetical protein
VAFSASQIVGIVWERSGGHDASAGQSAEGSLAEQKENRPGGKKQRSEKYRRGMECFFPRKMRMKAEKVLALQLPGVVVHDQNMAQTGGRK